MYNHVFFFLLIFCFVFGFERQIARPDTPYLPKFCFFGSGMFVVKHEILSRMENSHNNKSLKPIIYYHLLKTEKKYQNVYQNKTIWYLLSHIGVEKRKFTKMVIYLFIFHIYFKYNDIIKSNKNRWLCICVKRRL